MKWVETGPDHGWFWSMTLTHPGPPFRRPTWGQTATRAQAARALNACYGKERLRCVADGVHGAQPAGRLDGDWAEGEVGGGGHALN